MACHKQTRELIYMKYAQHEKCNKVMTKTINPKTLIVIMFIAWCMQKIGKLLKVGANGNNKTQLYMLNDSTNPPRSITHCS